MEKNNSSQTRRIVLWSIAAFCSIVALVIYGIPFAADRLAVFVPPAAEQRLGQAVDQQVRALFGGKICGGATGQTALTVLVERLTRAGGVETPLEIQALGTSLPNAFALPGGRIYVTRGLLEKAKSPDELAGIIGHELGHVQHRDGLRKLIQAGGTAFVVGLLFGDVIGGSAVIVATRSLVDGAYSRDTERSADAYAVELMHKLGRSPKPMGELLMRITGPEAGKGLTVLSGHPLTEDRLASLAKEDIQPTGADLVTAQEWAAIKTICRELR